MQDAPTINTRQVTGRRRLHFETVDDALADAERLAEAERQGKLHCLGNWTLGQSLGHLATWAQYAYEPSQLKVPAVVRLVMRPLRRRFLYKSIPAGRSIPRVPGGTYGTEELPLDEGLARFHRAYTRLQTEPPTRPHGLFGALTHDEWIQVNLRHAELHLSFVSAER